MIWRQFCSVHTYRLVWAMELSSSCSDPAQKVLMEPSSACSGPTQVDRNLVDRNGSIPDSKNGMDSLHV
ncbi:hypothetical protein GUJ93_ZPchr0007g4757 [Zizania palustris]|uniref:Uncharacterized protein n=1 Tax=Zizania palustris TaxID=103762 RepID=A0A8J5T3N8_ZIZPA|nr:hypothetical protein GUJ93_ZPchr0007g4757 [Zizania palustris]